jgi:hypothetical protein
MPTIGHHLARSSWDATSTLRPISGRSDDCFSPQVDEPHRVCIDRQQAPVTLLRAEQARTAFSFRATQMKRHPNRRASSAPTVVFPDPATPIKTTIIDRER